MKVAMIVLGALCLLLTVGLFLRHRSATAQAAASFQYTESLSNQIADIRVRLALADRATALTQSNLHALLDRRVGELASTSNRLLQATRLLSSISAQAKESSREAQPKAQPKAADLAALQTTREELNQLKAKMAPLLALPEQLNQAQAQISSLSAQRDWLIQELSRSRLTEADLKQKLVDPEFLRMQLAKTEEDAQMNERIVRARFSNPLEAGANRLLQSTGPVSSAAAPRAEPPAKRRTPAEPSPPQFYPLPALR